MKNPPTTDQLIAACKHALQQNLGVQAGERVLIVTDETKRDIAAAFKRACLQLQANVEKIEIPVLTFNGQEPPEAVAQKMLAAQVVLMPLAKSLSWTRARRAATDAGVRIASMARITEEMIVRTFPVDYHAIRARVNRLADLLDQTEQVRVQSELGTDLCVNVAHRQAHGRSGGIYSQPGKWGNLPCGEAFIAPVQTGTSGIYVVDASHAAVGAIAEPIRITVENGFATRIDGGAEAQTLRNELQAVGDHNAYNLAEFGIGCNEHARICGITLEDEKVLGTCHLALGNNIFFGGEVEVGIHIDGVLTAPTIHFDAQLIMERGALLV